MEASEGGIEFCETGGNGEVRVVSEVLAAFDFKGGELSASADFALFEPLSRR